MKCRKIIFIMTDSQRHDFVNCYRKTGLQTPNLDRIAENGVRFEQAYTTQPVCQAARSAIFTGQYPHTNGCWSNCEGMAQTSYTVGQRLQKDGVHTAYIGKWHLDGGDYFGMGVCPDGWDSDYWYDMRNYMDELSDEERFRSRQPEQMKARAFKAEDTFGHRCSDRAIDFLSKHHDEDFFLTVSYDEPHHPFICPPPYSTMYEGFSFPVSENVYDTLEDKPDYQRVWARNRINKPEDGIRLENPYFFGCNSFIDSEIGRVLDAAQQYAPDALIIYTSDHGDMLSSHSLWAKGPAAYEEITHIPFMMMGAGLPSGKVDALPVSHLNLMPTILELMGTEIPQTVEGKSLVPQMVSGERVNDYVFIEFGRYETDHDGFGGYQPMRAVFDGRYKLSINLLSTDELYDLKTDLGELINRIDDPAYREIRNRLHDALLNEMYRTRDPFRGYYWERRPWRTDAPDASWDDRLMTRQRMESESFEKRQLDYSTGLPIEETVRVKR